MTVLQDNKDDIDAEGFRSNVGIILTNGSGRVLWAKRVGQDAWQFPQGGIQAGETAEQAMYRELMEEVGLEPNHVRLIGTTHDWLRYKLPARYVRHDKLPLCIGQKQIWFLLQLEVQESMLRFDRGDKPEFERWRWVEYWHPLREVVYFKRDVYRRALQELSVHVPNTRHRARRTPWGRRY